MTIPDTLGLRVGAAEYPATRQKDFPKLGVTLSVYEGLVDIAIPVTPKAELLNWMKPEKPEAIEVPLSVLLQVCSETVCYPPRTESLSLAVTIDPLVTPGRRQR